MAKPADSLPPLGESDAALIREALDGAEGIDASHIDVVLREGEIALRGWVATREEASLATLLAEQAREAPSPVLDELQVDPNLREGEDDVLAGERTIPAEGEVLVGSTDMLAGPDAGATEDVARAFEEGEPWSPPDQPRFAGENQREFHAVDDGREVVIPPETSPAAADLSAAELAAAPSGTSLPGLVPEAAAPSGQDTPEAVSMDDLGRAPDDDALEPMVEQVPGTALGPGAVGEHATGGGSIGSVVAAETGATGVDTERADPARAAGGTSLGGGTHRGPQSRDDEALREDLPTED